MTEYHKFDCLNQWAYVLPGFQRPDGRDQGVNGAALLSPQQLWKPEVHLCQTVQSAFYDEWGRCPEGKAVPSVPPAIFRLLPAILAFLGLQLHRANLVSVSYDSPLCSPLCLISFLLQGLRTHPNIG